MRLSRANFPSFRLYIPPAVQQPFKAAAAIGIATLLLAGLYYPGSQPQLPIFYSMAQQSQQLAPKELIFLFPGISFVILAAHLAIIHALKNIDKLVLRLFALMTAILQFVLLLSLIRIIYITW